MITSPASAHNTAAAPAHGRTVAAAPGNVGVSGLPIGHRFIPRDDDDTTSTGGVGNITGGSRNVGGVRNSRVSGSGNVEEEDYGD
ncbi:hypothetical protein NE236_04100 [Actinoallomurus purpureus]|uniref:hypothetical protein n=1 Tax=Actinoallomurus purpureus TaxID=478114 RepID=UPI0020925C96|nr:hypothetical protein [Actinoallomurus purpureus]MCO6004153.1 hypothetical protein [Actinoallomurus purpureus]